MAATTISPGAGGAGATSNGSAGNSPSNYRVVSNRLVSDLTNLKARLPAVLGGVVEPEVDLSDSMGVVRFHVKVNATPDLIPMGLLTPYLLFQFICPGDYPWEPPAVHYLPPPGPSDGSHTSPEEQQFRAKWTRPIAAAPGGGGQEGGGSQEQQRLEMRLAILDTPDPKKPSCWSRAYNLENVFFSLRLALRRECATPFANPAWLCEQLPLPKKKALGSKGAPPLCLISGSSASQGERPFMEDTMLVSDELMADGASSLSLYCIFDGHGGDQCSVFAVNRIEKMLQEDLLSLHMNMAGPNGMGEVASAHLRTLLGNAVRKLDAEFIKAQVLRPPDAPPRRRSSQNPLDASNPNYQTDDLAKIFQDGMETVGSTALLILFDGTRRFFVASLGDCRAVMCRDGKAVEISVKEHKATRPDEVARICFQQGYVSGQRVQGKLAVSRALGDGGMKGYSPNVPGVLSADVEITEVSCVAACEGDERGTGDELVVMGSDGLWDVMTNKEVVDFVRQRLQDDKASKVVTSERVDRICEELVAHAITVKGSTDNVSVIAIVIVQSEERSEGEMAVYHQSSHNHFAGSKNTLAGVPAALDEDAGQWGFGDDDDDFKALHNNQGSNCRPVAVPVDEGRGCLFDVRSPQPIFDDDEGQQQQASSMDAPANPHQQVAGDEVDQLLRQTDHLFHGHGNNKAAEGAGAGLLTSSMRLRQQQAPPSPPSSEQHSIMSSSVRTGGGNRRSSGARAAEQRHEGKEGEAAAGTPR